MKKFISVLILIFCVSLNAFAITLDEAKGTFEAFVSLSNNYKKEVSSLYNDDTKIKRMLIFKDGTQQEITLNVEEYRKKVNFYRRLAMLIRYKLNFTEINYVKEGENVRVYGQRKPFARRETLPFEMLIGADKEGIICIKEELFYTKSTGYFKDYVEKQSLLD